MPRRPRPNRPCIGDLPTAWNGCAVEAKPGRDVNDSGLRERVRVVHQRLGAEGPPWTRAGDGDFDRVAVPQRDCDLLRDLLISEGVETSSRSAWPMAARHSAVVDIR
jgi:hypothetical protein